MSATKKARVDNVQAFIDVANSEYEHVHVKFEEQFWGTKMVLKQVPYVHYDRS